MAGRSIIRGLIGQCEDVHFDCREWPPDDGSRQKLFAKAACGLTNAEGGVLIVGMKAKASAKDEPDVVESAAPVPDMIAVKSRILDLVGQLVEPGIEGIRAQEVPEKKGSKSGFVVIFVPALQDGLPRRSRKDSKFYQCARRLKNAPFSSSRLALEVQLKPGYRAFGGQKTPKRGCWCNRLP